MPKRRMPRKGDVYTFKVGALHYVFHYIDVVDEPQSVHPQFRFRSLGVVFENGYSAVPERPNLTRIYRIKSRPKGQLLYIMMLGLKPSLPAGLRYWGHVDPTGSWIPAIDVSTEMPIEARLVDGVEITPTPAAFPYVRGRIEDDQRRTKSAVVDPLIFKEWIEAVDGPVIMRAEALITALRDRVGKGTSPRRALGICMRALNKLDAKHGFIGTIEAEDLVEALLAEVAEGGLESAEVEELIDSLRDW